MRAEVSHGRAEGTGCSVAARTGRVIAVVGPSGVGKDSVMAGLLRLHPELSILRRAITRPPDPGGEDHEPVSLETFLALDRSGAFALSWRAHALHYGVPRAALSPTGAGRDVLANLSRSVLATAARRFPRFEVLHLRADASILAARLHRRGREEPSAIAVRLARDARPLPEGLRIHEIDNGGALADAVEAASHALYPRN